MDGEWRQLFWSATDPTKNAEKFWRLQTLASGEDVISHGVDVLG
jgi:hypothetical protein